MPVWYSFHAGLGVNDTAGIVVSGNDRWLAHGAHFLHLCPPGLMIDFSRNMHLEKVDRNKN